ncbi:anti-anti-sigma factor [Pseudoxanthomonas broegbernensis]|uniref:Anti-anti-sigma factor n=1 Tax=Pseudoxanthomonas broegbernensis TaxID=83619 RepID=A0A7V8K6J6_9GAMM|nr:STAS domain-containing protein [Pseudoxanthomonas broegbernensis]KAF1685629.1 anti-anti-sigma factor [Pseudoxanthomonas broegbernensis]MBB6066005.1 anti-anti-sigma regulatory factor [Pseudoxanthomonas broegbernensis]
MNTVPLGEDLGIEASAELKERLAAHLEEPELALDGTAVRRVHTAAMQVLCAFFRSRGELGRSTTLAGCSDALRDAARLLGLAGQLGLTGADQDMKQTVENAA